MENFTKIKNLVITCDNKGIIKGIISEDIKLKEDNCVGKTLSSILDDQSFGKANHFLNKIINKKNAFNFDMVLNTDEGNSIFDFSGISFNDSLLIIATNAQYETNELFAEMGQIINEQTNIIRACNEEKARMSKIERERIAKELHDTVSQTIFSTRVIAELLPELWEKNKNEALKQIEKLKILTGESLVQMRRVLLELRPDAFEEEDINELLEQLANSVKLRSNMDVSFKTSGLGKPGRQIKESVYRITQEALNNAIKHAEAKKIDISLEYRGKKLYLKITDDGKGFDIKNVAKNKYGLYIMNERANSINAGLKITSNIDKGTEILLSCSME